MMIRRQLWCIKLALFSEKISISILNFWISTWLLIESNSHQYDEKMGCQMGSISTRVWGIFILWHRSASRLLPIDGLILNYIFHNDEGQKPSNKRGKEYCTALSGPFVAHLGELVLCFTDWYHWWTLMQTFFNRS